MCAAAPAANFRICVAGIDSIDEGRSTRTLSLIREYEFLIHFGEACQTVDPVAAPPLALKPVWMAESLRSRRTAALMCPQKGAAWATTQPVALS